MATEWPDDKVASAPAAPKPDTGGWPDDKTLSGSEASSAVMDFFKSIPRGALKGLMEGGTLLNDVATLGGTAAVRAGVGALGGQSPTMETLMPRAEKTISAVEQKVGAELPKPEGAAGKYGETVGEFVGNPASYIGPGGPALKIISAVTGALGSEAAGQYTEGSGWEPYARVIGAVMGSILPSSVVRATTPRTIPGERQAHIDTLEREGVTARTAGQDTGWRGLKWAESHLGEAPLAGHRAEDVMRQQTEQFTRAALARIGETADRATPEVINRAATRIGAQFDALAARNTATRDVDYVQEMLRLQGEYHNLVPETMRKPIIDNLVNDAFSRLAYSPRMTGEEFQRLRSRIERYRRTSGKADPELNMTLAGFVDAMDNMMWRSIRASRPEDMAAWQIARQQYRNLLVIETAAAGAGEAAALGTISPAKLRQADVAKEGKRGYVRDRGDFSELARAGEAILKPLPQSGTAPRALTEKGLLKNIAAGIEGRTIMSPWMQWYLGGGLGRILGTTAVETPGAVVTASRATGVEATRQMGAD